MKTSENITELAKSLSAMQSRMEAATKSTEAYKYKYSDMASIWKVLREPMTENGISVVQDAHSNETGVFVTTRMLHNSGEWMEFGPLSIPMGKRDAHSTGSAISYAKRYALCAALGIVTEDDDGQAAQKAAQKEQKGYKPRTITDEQYQELENYLVDNDNLRQRILNRLKEDYNIHSLQLMPVFKYAQALKQAKEEHEEQTQFIEGAEG